jgi:hypothetical protein
VVDGFRTRLAAPECAADEPVTDVVPFGPPRAGVGGCWYGFLPLVAIFAEPIDKDFAAASSKQEPTQCNELEG